MLLVLPLSAEPKADTAEVATSDSIVVSLLTCSPGEQAYEFYGHTALRVRELRNGAWSDWVFNYGTFSFQKPHFMWRFILGETDYELGVVPYVVFFESYRREERGIYEQRILFSQSEAQKIVETLSHNLQPENATYRYNFFYNNCVTRAVEDIEQAVAGEVIWQPIKQDGKSLRDIVHQYSAVSPWDSFGQDLLLGAEADEPAPLAYQMFAPLYTMNFVSTAKVKRADGKLTPLAAPVITLLSEQTQPSKGGALLTPAWTFSLLLVFTLCLCFAEWKRRKYYWQYDVLLLLAQGLTGCIVTFLFFFSAHPTVGSNWLVVLFNPLPLLFFAWLMRDAVRGKRTWGMYVQPIMLLLVLVFGVLGLQQFPVSIYLIIIILALRVIAHFLSYPNAKKISS